MEWKLLAWAASMLYRTQCQCIELKGSLSTFVSLTMYIPNLLNWLPLASLTFTSYKHEDPPRKLGNLTPYRVAPAFPVEAELPGDCSVDRVMLVWLGFSLRSGD